ncbi:MAG: hypothetical protein V1913_12165 [Fibrobacterota bacterium]
MDEIREYAQQMAEEIRRHKWIASQQAGHDLGEKAIREWREEYEEDFRLNWLKNRYSLN